MHTNHLEERIKKLIDKKKKYIVDDGVVNNRGVHIEAHVRHKKSSKIYRVVILFLGWTFRFQKQFLRNEYVLCMWKNKIQYDL